MWRHVAANALTVLIVGLFLLGGVVAWGARQYSGEGPLAEAICLRVPSGSSMRAVSAELAGQGAIASATVFRVGADYADKSGQLKAGSFLVPARASMRDIVDLVTRGGASSCGTEVVWRIGVNRTVAQVRELDPATDAFVETAEFDPASPEPAGYRAARDDPDTTYRVVLAEGVTAWQVVQALGAIDGLDGDPPEVPPEGSLAPGDYPFAPGATAVDLVAQMTAAQGAILAEAWAGRAEGLPLATPEEALTLASIVEKETGVPEERARVASVFVNRLRQGMRLQTDPAVIYGVTGGQGPLGRGLRRSELVADTPYNTYVIDGLPPTPIANPGRAAIEAALHPDPTDYLFFVADGSGGHAFATNLADHNRNVARWRRIEAEQAAEAAAAEAAGNEPATGDGPAATTGD